MWRFNYLKSLLEDGALSTIQGLPLTAANYKTAIDLLTEHFGWKSVIVSSLLKLPSLFNCNDIRKLRQLYDTIEVHIRGLQSLDVSSETYGMLLVPVLLSKIPEEIRLIIGRKVKDDTWDLDTLITNLKEEIDAREKCTLVKASAEHAPKKQNYINHNKRPSSASALYLSNNRGESCGFCGNKHALQDCFNVTSIQARKEILRKAGRCFMCLRKNHLARECNSKGKCFKCSQKHHISLCNLYEKKTFNTVVKKSEEPVVEKGQEPVAGAQVTKTATCLYVNLHKFILLQTVACIVSNTNSANTGIKLHIIFDQGSQHSYLSQ